MNRVLLDLNNHKDIIEGYVKEANLKNINLPEFIKTIQSGITDDINTRDLVLYSSETAASLVTKHPDYSKLAQMILMSYVSVVTPDSFSKKFIFIQKKKNIFKNKIKEFVLENEKKLNEIVCYERDFDVNYFGLVSFLKSYCIKIDNEWIETPQDVYMRVAIQLHMGNFTNIKSTYDLLSLQYYSHATPTFIHSCFNNSQLASCFLMAMKEDSIEGIYDTLSHAATNLLHSGGMGIHISNIRPRGSSLNKTGGEAKGIVPVIKLFDDSCSYITLGGQKRASSVAFYIEPWHKDIYDFLDLRKNNGDEERRSRNVFTALWIPDLFMERVRNDGMWGLFDSNHCPELSNLHNEEFVKKYLEYESIYKDGTAVRAQDLWQRIILSQIETGTPYLLYKDAANRLSNQKNLGTIKSSNLCAEIIQYSDGEETAVCILASLCLPKFVVENSNGEKYFNFDLFSKVTQEVTFNLNRLIDSNYYVDKLSERANTSHRPIGIGVQGLADAFMMLGYPFESNEAKELNSKIFEAIYFSAVKKSVEMARQEGFTYSSFKGSDLSKGIFQFEKYKTVTQLSGLFDWESLRKDVVTYGTRNSLFVALMPTATTAQICGNFECFEPITSNIFTRRTFAGEFQCVNKYLINDLVNIGLWDDNMRQRIIQNDGSIQSIHGIPEKIKLLYKTVWEIKMKCVIDLSADRQRFIDQSQSLNLYLSKPTFNQLTSMHFYSWEKGLITGMYYLRTQPIASCIKFTIDQNLPTHFNPISSEESQDNSDLLDSISCDGCGA